MYNFYIENIHISTRTLSSGDIFPHPFASVLLIRAFKEKPFYLDLTYPPHRYTNI